MQVSRACRRRGWALGGWQPPGVRASLGIGGIERWWIGRKHGRGWGGMSRGNICSRPAAGSTSGQTGRERRGEMETCPVRRAAVSISPKSSRDNGGREGDREGGEGGGRESAPKTFNSPQSPELRTPVCSSCWVGPHLLDPAWTKSTNTVIRHQMPAAVL